MPNIGVLLKQEISRLSRKETRAEVQALKNASAQYRKNIAALRIQVATLERQVAALLRRGAVQAPPPADSSAGPKMRFVAKGFKSLRARLGLSAADFGKLLGVTAQSIYNWEQEAASPRPEQLKKIAALRSAGKRDVLKYLEQLPEPAPPKKRKG